MQKISLKLTFHKKYEIKTKKHFKNFMFDLLKVEYNKRGLFDFNLLSEENLREVIKYTWAQDQIKLLLVCRKWNKLFLPFIWESIIPNKYAIYPISMSKAYKKNGHLIKYLNFNTFADIPIFHGLYNNAIEISTSLMTYVKKQLFKYNIKITGMILHDYYEGLGLEEYIFTNQLDMTDICKDLKYLEIYPITNYFVEKIVPILPSTIKSIKLESQNDGYLIEKIINKFPNLTELEITDIDSYFYNWNSFLKLFFINLKSLVLEVSIYNPGEVIIDSSLMPQLINLKCHVDQIQFKGKFKLRDIKLHGVYSKLLSFSNEYFPYLRILTLENIGSLGVQLLRSIFELTSLNELVIRDCNTQIFQLKEVFPKKLNHLTSLKLVNCTLGYDFFNFLFICCKKLEVLFISLNLYESHPFLNEKILKHISFTNLNLIQLIINNYNNNLDKAIEKIIKHSPKLINFIVDDIPNINDQILSKNLNKLKSINVDQYIIFE